MQTTTDPLSAVKHYIDCFNKGDVKGMAAVCASPMSILDGMPPHTWHSATASEDWYRDVLAEGERHGAGGYLVSLGEPWHVNVTGDRAYVVVPASMKFKVHGKEVNQTGAVFTVALCELSEGWRLTAWAWAKGTAKA